MYQAVDGDGQTVDVFLSKQQNVQVTDILSGCALLKKRRSVVNKLDAHAAWHRAIQESKQSGEIFRNSVVSALKLSATK